jgi:hypothetical protein
MPALYRSAFAPREQPDALVIHCSDPRFQRHFHEFLCAHLGLDTYGLVAVPGGVHFLTALDYLPKFYWVGWRWVKFLVDLGRPRRLILLAHDDCRWYQDLRFRRGDDSKRAALSDLVKVRDGFQERFGRISVETYYARLEGGEVAFEEVR